jgi:E3 ubiquitin-protein ligase HUWE1
VDFQGEEGLDLGGLHVNGSPSSLKTYSTPTTRFLFWLQTAFPSNQTHAPINPDHLDYFNFIGRVIGKALLDGLCLEVHFTRSLYKHILGQEVTVSDMEDLDTEMYKGLQDLLSIDMDSSEVFECYFAYEEEHFGTVVTKELVPNGKMLRVTEKNKGEYVKHLCSMKMTDSIQVQITAFLAGLYSLIPQGLLSSGFDRSMVSNKSSC